MDDRYITLSVHRDLVYRLRSLDPAVKMAGFVKKAMLAEIARLEREKEQAAA